MSGYELHPEAWIDLHEIGQHLADDSPAAAKRVITEIFDAISALVRFPQPGASPHRPHDAPTALYPRIRLSIAYAPDEQPLWVVAVFHGHRSPRVMAAILRGREEKPGKFI